MPARFQTRAFSPIQLGPAPHVLRMVGASAMPLHSQPSAGERCHLAVLCISDGRVWLALLFRCFRGCTMAHLQFAPRCLAISDAFPVLDIPLLSSRGSQSTIAEGLAHAPDSRACWAHRWSGHHMASFGAQEFLAAGVSLSPPSRPQQSASQ